jgi:eukaryotic-like serine/threonine-protein kinase
MTEPFPGCRVVALVRSGPVADLYEAIQEPLGRRVFVKALSPSILPSSPFAAVLEREARVAAELDHPGALRLLDFVRTNERMWLVLEHVDGWELAHLLERQRTQAPPGPRDSSISAAVALALQIAEALGHAHRASVVHRALHPQNVLVGRNGHIKLTSFSLQLDETPAALPEAVDVTGPRSAAYLAPEQILGETADPRSDFFALGVLLYEIVTGHCPFVGDDEASIAQRVRHDSPPLLCRVTPAAPGSLERLVARCLEKLPGDRFQSAEELAQALRSILGELGVKDAAASVRNWLGDTGLIPHEGGQAPTPRLAQRGDRPQGLPLRGLLAALVLMLTGGIVIQWLGYASADPGQTVSQGPLELIPVDAATLRVVAEPWAHVFVDGQRVATTPFAEAVPLRPGTHHVRLDHPNAPSEHRTLVLSPGESVLLDVAMNVEVPPPPVSPVPLPEDDETP